MSCALLENFLIRSGVPADDWNGESSMSFTYNDVECSLESISEEHVRLTIDDETLATNDLTEAVEFFYDIIGIDDRERAIDELELELRSTFGRQ